MRSSYTLKQWKAIAVCVTVRCDHNQVNDPPDTATTRCEQLNQTDPDVARIETMNAEDSHEDTQEERS